MDYNSDKQKWAGSASEWPNELNTKNRLETKKRIEIEKKRERELRKTRGLSLSRADQDFWAYSVYFTQILIVLG